MRVEAEVLDRLSVAILQLDEDGRIKGWNQAASEFFDLSWEDAAGKFFYDLLGSKLVEGGFETVHKIQDLCAQALKNHQPQKTVLKSTDGRRLCLWCLPVAETQTINPGGLLILEDIPLQQKTPTELLDEADRRGMLKMAATMVHKLNQPFQVIIGYISLMMLDTSPEHPNYTHFNKMLEQLEEAQKIIQKLSKITRQAVS